MALEDWASARIIFVCSGNICRSPMAQVLCEQLFRAHGLDPMVISMGTLGIVGHGADPLAIAAAAEVDCDLSDFRSQAIKGTLLNAATVAFGMEQHHVDSMRKYGQGAFRCTRLLTRWAPEKTTGVVDPIGGTLDDFRTARDLIKACITSWFESEVRGR